MPATTDRTGVLLVNVGTPDAPRAKEVRRYLREFLGDPRVLDVPAAGRWALLNLVILPFRPSRSAEAYRTIWTPDGSPLLTYGRALVRVLRDRLGTGYDVRLAMRYGNPSIAQAMEGFRADGIHRIVVFPLYPQYAASTTATSLDAVYRRASTGWDVPQIATVSPFFEDPGFLDAFARVGRPVLDDLDPDHVLFSFHGLPERQIRKSDPTGDHCLRREGCCEESGPVLATCYRAQCVRTARGIAKRLGLDAKAWSLAFQSRLGRTPWIRPYTDRRVRELAESGVRRLAVYCPAFVADCLETLEEIGLRAREEFLESGGEDLRLVPSLNDDPAWADVAARLVRRAAGEPATPAGAPS